MLPTFCSVKFFNPVQPFYFYLAFIVELNQQSKQSFMKSIFIPAIFLLLTWKANAQNAQDLFRPDVPITWLGIDYSHCKLVGSFSEFADAGRKSTWQIRDEYFPRWNAIIMYEPEKYDVRGMLRRGDMGFDLDMITRINAETSLAEMEVFSPVVYSQEDIRTFADQYEFKTDYGIGIVFIAESMNKIMREAWYHFVAIDMSTGQVILQERLMGQPSGVGLRNYWANSIHKVIRNIGSYYYWNWKRQASKNTVQML